MKKLNIFIAVALVAAFTFSSCNSNKPKLPELKTQLDSLNYALGVAYGDNLKTNYIKGDSAKKSIKLLFEGMSEGSKGTVDKENEDLASLGNQIGSSLKQQVKAGFLGDSALKLDYKLIKQGLLNGLKNNKEQMSPMQAQEYLKTTMMARQAVKMEKDFGPNKKAGELFLSENAKKAGVVTTASGLQYEVIKKGTGPIPSATNRVKVNYHGTLIDGTVFDSSVDRKEPVVFPVNGVIKGWTEALQLMPVGSKYKIYVPQQLAYGAQGSQGKIKPFSMLIFEVELLSIEKDAPAQQQLTPEQMQQLQQQMQQQQR
jgi:FKBP-type peptidyl-prolyl cis-trans isomerase FkpA